MKYIQTFEQFINENKIVNEAARVGRHSWKSVLKDLSHEGWEIDGDYATQYFGDGQEIEITLGSMGEIEYEVKNHRGRVVDSGSFDAEGLSAGELSSEVWDYVDESINESRTVKTNIEDLKVGDIFYMIYDQDEERVSNGLSTIGNSGSIHQMHPYMYRKIPFKVVEIDTKRNSVNCVTANKSDEKKIPFRHYHSIKGKSLLRFRIPGRGINKYVDKVN